MFDKINIIYVREIYFFGIIKFKHFYFTENR